jgi:hypothetical protein
MALHIIYVLMRQGGMSHREHIWHMWWVQSSIFIHVIPALLYGLHIILTIVLILAVLVGCLKHHLIVAKLVLVHNIQRLVVRANPSSYTATTETVGLRSYLKIRATLPTFQSVSIIHIIVDSEHCAFGNRLISNPWECHLKRLSPLMGVSASFIFHYSICSIRRDLWLASVGRVLLVNGLLVLNLILVLWSEHAAEPLLHLYSFTLVSSVVFVVPCLRGSHCPVLILLLIETLLSSVSFLLL